MSVLSPFVTLEQVVLLSSSARSQLDPRALPERPPSLALSQHCSGILEPDNRVQVHAEAQLIGQIDEVEVLRIEAVYGVYYVLPPELQVEQQDVDAFAEQNGMFNAWPYLRELLANLSAKMGLPLPPLPLLRAVHGDRNAGEE